MVRITRSVLSMLKEEHEQKYPGGEYGGIPAEVRRITEDGMVELDRRLREAGYYFS